MRAGGSAGTWKARLEVFPLEMGSVAFPTGAPTCTVMLRLARLWRKRTTGRSGETFRVGLATGSPSAVKNDTFPWSVVRVWMVRKTVTASP